MMKKLLLLLACYALPSAGWAYDVDVSQYADSSELWLNKDDDHRGPRGPQGHRGHRGDRGHHGKRGEHGREGIFGVVGPTGTVGLPFITSLLDTFISGADGATIAIGNGDYVPFSDAAGSDTLTVGGPFTFNSTGSGTTISFGDPGYYLISYGVCVTPLGSLNINALFVILQNGVPVPSSFLSATNVVGELSMVRQDIIILVNAGDTIALANETGPFTTVAISGVNNSSDQGGTAAYLTAVKVREAP